MSKSTAQPRPVRPRTAASGNMRRRGHGARLSADAKRTLDRFAADVARHGRVTARAIASVKALRERAWGGALDAITLAEAKQYTRIGNAAHKLLCELEEIQGRSLTKGKYLAKEKR